MRLIINDYVIEVSSAYIVTRSRAVKSTSHVTVHKPPRISHCCPANTKHLNNICTTSAQRLRRWANIVQLVYKCFALTGWFNAGRAYHVLCWLVEPGRTSFVLNMSHVVEDVWQCMYTYIYAYDNVEYHAAMQSQKAVTTIFTFVEILFLIFQKMNHKWNEMHRVLGHLCAHIG